MRQWRRAPLDTCLHRGNHRPDGGAGLQARAPDGARDMDYQTENKASGRQILPDLTRAFALVGIALVNVGFMAWPAMIGYHAGGLETGIDEAAHFLVSALFLYKSYTLFAFMFGVGFAYQIRSAERRGTGFGGEYWRRIAGLVILGLLHVALLFQGDILVIYAVLGSVLFLFRKASEKTLIRWAIGIYLVQILVLAAMAGLVWLGFALAPDEMARQSLETREDAEWAFSVFGAGTFAETVVLRLAEWSEIVVFGLIMQGFGALSFFLFGLAAVRGGVIADPSAPIWRRARRAFLPIGLAGSAVGAWIMMGADDFISPEVMFGLFLITLFSPFASAGYIGLIARWAERPASPVKTFLARGGTATLTAYLMQGLLFSLIFNGYGLGLFATLGAAACTAIAFGVALFSIIFSSLWRTRFKRGPMEALLRSWTYLGAR